MPGRSFVSRGGGTQITQITQMFLADYAEVSRRLTQIMKGFMDTMDNVGLSLSQLNPGKSAFLSASICVKPQSFNFTTLKPVKLS